jgi:hypothetical protein
MRGIQAEFGGEALRNAWKCVRPAANQAIFASSFPAFVRTRANREIGALK